MCLPRCEISEHARPGRRLLPVEVAARVEQLRERVDRRLDLVERRAADQLRGERVDAALGEKVATNLVEVVALAHACTAPSTRSASTATSLSGRSPSRSRGACSPPWLRSRSAS